MANTTASGSVAMNDVLDYITKHPVPEGQKGYTKGTKEYDAFHAWYRKQCGDVIRTNRGNEYRNKENDDRLDQHARWHLRKAVEAAAKPPKAPKVTKGETEAGDKEPKQGGRGARKAHAA